MRVSCRAFPDGQLVLEGQQEIQMGKEGNQRDLIGTISHSNMGLGDPSEFLPAPHLSCYHLLLLSPLLSLCLALSQGLDSGPAGLNLCSWG